MAQIWADRGGGGSPALHGAKRRKDGETPAITKRSRIAAETARPLRQGAGTGPELLDQRGGIAASYLETYGFRLLCRPGFRTGDSIGRSTGGEGS